MKQTNTRPELQYKDGLPMSVKSFDDEQGVAELIVSCFTNIDRANDVIPFGAFAKSLQRKLPKGIWMHDWSQPIAKTLEARELMPGDPLLTKENAGLGGLYIKAKFNLETQRGREAYSDIKQGIIDEFSIGYKATKESSRADGANVLEEIELYEWSAVLVGCNPNTSVISIKADMTQDNTAQLQTKDIKDLVHFKGTYLGEKIESSLAYNALCNLSNALCWALWDIIYYSSGTTAEKITQISEACDEFKTIGVKVSAAILAEGATEDSVQKAFGEILTKDFVVPDVKAGAKFSSKNKTLINSKCESMKAMAADLESHAKELEDMVSDGDAEEEKSATTGATPAAINTKNDPAAAARLAQLAAFELELAEPIPGIDLGY